MLVPTQAGKHSTGEDDEYEQEAEERPTTLGRGEVLDVVVVSVVVLVAVAVGLPGDRLGTAALARRRPGHDGTSRSGSTAAGTSHGSRGGRRV